MLHLPAWISACTLAGLLVGAAVGEYVVRQQHREMAGELAAAYVRHADELYTEAIAVLERIETLPPPACSDANVLQLRQIALTSRYLKSVAQLDDERRLLCSSLLGRLQAPARLPAPDVVTEDNLRILFDSDALTVPGSDVVVIGSNNAAVVIGQASHEVLVDPRLSYIGVADFGDDRRVFLRSGTGLDIGAAPLVDRGHVTWNDQRFEVRCSTLHSGCLVARLREPTPSMASPVFLAFCGFGMLSGVFGGLGGSALLARRRSIGRRLRTALVRGDLEIVYQSVVRLADREPVGAEALLRWRDEQGRPMSPEVFISMAEQEGFIGDVTRYAVRRVLTELAPFLRTHPNFRVAVNIAVSDLLDASFSTFVQQELHASGVPAARLAFEITERSTASLDAIERGLRRLRADGHAVYIDDFGADYSSLSYLARLPVDGIKLDRSFSLMLREHATRSIAPQIVDMARALGLALVVEGIETEAQAAYFRKLEADAMGQGWLFGKPMTAQELVAR